MGGNTSARFQVDSRLAKLLSQEYSSTEKALKELVDNAWDADATMVDISLPPPMSSESITVRDDGTGMTTEELRRHYLAIAADRRVHRGDRTRRFNRLVKGRKGIGKFAGLMAASEMGLETYTGGTSSCFVLRLSDLASVEDIEHLPISIASQPCDGALHGTIITLSGLHTGLAFPDPRKVRQVLLHEYGRATDIEITVNGKPLGIDDVDGIYSDESFSLKGVGPVRMRFAISDGRVAAKEPGLVIRVDGKAIGKPSFFGLDEQQDFPPKLLKRLYGDVDADGLRDHVTAGWDSLIENSELLAALVEHVQPIVHRAFKERYGREIQLAQARLRKDVHDRLASMPEHRRQYADRAIKRVLDRFFGEAPEKVEPYVFVLLEAIERSEYATVLEHLAEASRKDVSSIADALAEFGLAEMAHLIDQATARQSFLDQLEQLAREPTTLEAQMHKAIELNLWIFGPEYSLFSSNRTLQRLIEDLLGEKYPGPRPKDRPDLLLNENLNAEYLLIEFKRPSHALDHGDYSQAIRYRHDLKKSINRAVKVLLVGGQRSGDYPIANLEPDVSAVTFVEVIATARRQLQWMLRSRD
jgi:hypothetical protein